MPRLFRRSIRFAPVVMTGSALTLVLLIGWWGMYRDLKAVQEAVTASELTQVRSHAERTVRRLERELSSDTSLADFLTGSGKEWLEDHWTRTVLNEPSTLYGAVVTDEFIALARSRSDAGGSPRPAAIAIIDRRTQGESLLPRMDDGALLAEYGAEFRLVKQRSEGEQELIDVRLPILWDSNVVGHYRIGLDFAKLQEKVLVAQRSSSRSWSIVISATALIVIGASISLYRLGMHSFRLEQALGTAEARRLAELNQLVIGLAHEVRNPLNAIRLNLFTAERVMRGETHIPQAEAVSMLQESVDEIERVDGLIGQLLGYARINVSAPTGLDLDDEIRALLQFLRGLHESENVNIHYEHPCADLSVRIGQQCFRQVLLNLLQNACQATGPGGSINLHTYSEGDMAVVAVHDNGPGIPAGAVEQIFEPFFSTRENGVGMGLAVVKRLVENAGGVIQCDRSKQLSGMEFLVKLPVTRT